LGGEGEGGELLSREASGFMSTGLSGPKLDGPLSRLFASIVKPEERKTLKTENLVLLSMNSSCDCVMCCSCSAGTESLKYRTGTFNLLQNIRNDTVTVTIDKMGVIEVCLICSCA